MWQVRYLLIFNRLLVPHKSKTVVKIRHQILCVCVHVHVCKSSLFCFTFICFFIYWRHCLFFSLCFSFSSFIFVHRVLSDSKYKLKNSADYLTFFYQQSQVLLFFVVVFASVGYFYVLCTRYYVGWCYIFCTYMHAKYCISVCFESTNIK